MNQWVLSEVPTEERHYLFFDRGQDVVGGVVSLHVAASWTVANGQQKPLLRHWALLRSWHSSCVKHTCTHTQTHMIWSPRAFFWEKKNLVHTYQTVCMYVQTHTHNTLLSKPLPETHRRVMRSDYQWPRAAATTSKTQNTHPHTPYGPKRKRLSMFHVCDSANQCHMALRQHTS